jgi:hypothetical protein
MILPIKLLARYGVVPLTQKAHPLSLLLASAFTTVKDSGGLALKKHSLHTVDRKPRERNIILTLLSLG